MEDNRSATHTLFGAELGWHPEDWTDSDDRVRGGSSQSHLDVEGSSASFRGVLDIETLGGAGFASQRTTGDDRHWDLSSYNGINITFDPAKTDDKTYTFILKDELLPPDPENGREQSTVSWEFDFNKKDVLVALDSANSTIVTIPWHKFKPTYRGRPKKNAEPLAKNNIKRISIMMRSFFGTQHGDFNLNIMSIAGVPPNGSTRRASASITSTNDDVSNLKSVEKATKPNATTPTPGFWSRIFCWDYTSKTG